MAGSREENGKPRQVEQRNTDIFLENAMNAGASVYYINMNNSKKQAQEDKDKERPEIPVDGNWDK